MLAVGRSVNILTNPSARLPAAGRGVPRGDAAERDPVGDEERPIHPTDGSARPHTHLPLLHRRLHLFPR